MHTIDFDDFTFYPTFMIVDDLNNDSQLDMIVTNTVGDDIRLLFGDGNGTFPNRTTYSTGIGSNPQSIASGDFDNDNRKDIVVAHSGTGGVSILLNVNSGSFGSVRTFSTGSNSKTHGTLACWRLSIAMDI